MKLVKTFNYWRSIKRKRVSRKKKKSSKSKKSSRRNRSRVKVKAKSQMIKVKAIQVKSRTKNQTTRRQNLKKVSSPKKIIRKAKTTIQEKINLGKARSLKMRNLKIKKTKR